MGRKRKGGKKFCRRILNVRHNSGSGPRLRGGERDAGEYVDAKDSGKNKGEGKARGRKRIAPQKLQQKKTARTAVCNSFGGSIRSKVAGKRTFQDIGI